MRRIDAQAAISSEPWHVPATKADAPLHASVDPTPSAEEVHRARLQEAFAQAREQGRSAGLAEADRLVAERVEQGVATLRQTLEREAEEQSERIQAREQELAHWLSALPAALRNAEHEAEEAAVAATYAAVAHFLGERYAEGDVLRSLCVQALRQGRGEECVIHLGPDDSAEFVAPEGVTLATDISLQPGECRIETALGHYDSGLDVRLDLIRDALLAGLRQHRAERDRP